MVLQEYYSSSLLMKRWSPTRRRCVEVGIRTDYETSNGVIWSRLLRSEQLWRSVCILRWSPRTQPSLQRVIAWNWHSGPGSQSRQNGLTMSSSAFHIGTAVLTMSNMKAVKGTSNIETERSQERVRTFRRRANH